MPVLDDVRTEVMETDVLVVGAGIAGCHAAIRARESGMDVVIVDKGNLGRSGLSPQMSGVLTFFDPEKDDYDAWYREGVESGEWVVDQKILDNMFNETADRVRDMDSWGVTFQKERREFIRKPSVGCIYGRVALLTHGGSQLMSVLRGEVVRHGIRLVERVMVTDLLTSDGELPTSGRIVGAVGFNIRDGKLHVFKARATIIATGVTTSVLLGAVMPTLSGDGKGMGFRAGCEMRNIELSSISIRRAAGLTNPQGPGANILFGEGAILVNANGNRFMKKWDPVRMARSTRAVVARAIATEELEGRGPVYLDATHLSEAAHARIEKCIPITVRSLAALGLDFRRDKIPYTTTLEDGSAGGIRVNRENATTVRALYAVGDASDHAEMGVTDIISPGMAGAIGGYRAGETATQYAAEAEEPGINEHQIQLLKDHIFAPMKCKTGLKHQEVREHCKSIIRKGLLGPVRDEPGLKEAIGAAREIRDDEIPKVGAKDYHELARSIGLENELLLLELLPRSALLRTESRGSHYRRDYPRRDDANWLKWVIARREGDSIKVWAEPIPFEEYALKPKPPQ